MPCHDSLKIREMIADKHAEATALSALADEGKRELTADESASFDSLIEEIGEPGENATGLYAALATAEKFDRIKADLAAKQNPAPAQPREDIGSPRIEAVSHVGTLKAFAGKEAAAHRCGHFLLASLCGNDKSRQWCHDQGIRIRSAASGGDNGKGGFLVPDEFEATVIDLRETYGVFRSNTKVVPMGSDHKIQPRRKSGLTAYAVNDNTEITASDKEWNAVELTAKKWGILSLYSSELNEDSVVSIADDLASEIAWALAKKEDQSGFIGDGTSTYHGVVGVVEKANDGSHAAALFTAATGNTAFSTLDLADFEQMAAKLPVYAEAGAKWYISKIGYWHSMANLMNAAGGNATADLGSGPVRQFLGYPVEFVQVMNTTTTAQVSTAGLCAFGDLNLASTLGDRRGLSVAADSSRYFEKDQLAIRGTTRTAINVHDMGDASTTGPMVVLKTPGS